MKKLGVNDTEYKNYGLADILGGLKKWAEQPSSVFEVKENEVNLIFISILEKVISGHIKELETFKPGSADIQDWKDFAMKVTQYTLKKGAKIKEAQNEAKSLGSINFSDSEDDEKKPSVAPTSTSSPEVNEGEENEGEENEGEENEADSKDDEGLASPTPRASPKPQESELLSESDHDKTDEGNEGEENEGEGR